MATIKLTLQKLYDILTFSAMSNVLLYMSNLEFSLQVSLVGSLGSFLKFVFILTLANVNVSKAEK